MKALGDYNALDIFMDATNEKLVVLEYKNGETTNTSIDLNHRYGGNKYMIVIFKGENTMSDFGVMVNIDIENGTIEDFDMGDSQIVANTNIEIQDMDFTYNFYDNYFYTITFEFNGVIYTTQYNYALEVINQTDKYYVLVNQFGRFKFMVNETDGEISLTLVEGN